MADDQLQAGLKDKVVIITGASSGIGAATAVALYHEGARLVLAGRREDRLTQVQSELSGRCLVVAGDVRDDAFLQRLLAETTAWGGRLDILVNNAGLSLGRPLATSTAEDYETMLDTNLLALANLTRLAAPHLRASRGQIVNVSSVAARSSTPNSAMYGATKAAVGAFSEAVRKELLKDGVRVTTVLPGAVETEFLEHLPDETMRSAMREMMAKLTPLKAVDVAEAIIFALTRPEHVAISEIVIRPARQEM